MLRTAMSGAMLTTTSAAPIQAVTNLMSYYGSLFVFFVGTVGSCCNLITFTAPQLRKNACAFYFFASSFFELLSITFGLISRFAADNLNSTLINTNPAYCKLRAYLVTAVPLMATYLVLLSSLDRWLSSSANAKLRSFSQIKMAYRATSLAILVGLVSCSHILVLYDLRPRCAMTPGVYAKFDGLFVVVWLGIIPHGLMLFFGFCTIMNIRRAKQRIMAQPQIKIPTVSGRQRRDHKTDTQLILVSHLSDGRDEPRNASCSAQSMFNGENQCLINCRSLSLP
jgi:hypothetical protein